MTEKETRHFAFSEWIEGSEGRPLLQARADLAMAAFLPEELGRRLQEELAALVQPDSRDFRFANSIWPLSEDLGFLCLAEKSGIEIPAAVWEAVHRDFIPAIFGIDEINFQGRTNKRKWNSDLATAEIGVNLALALHLDTAGRLDHPRLELFLRRKCLEPILADWLHHETRLHALDTMGHNWWSVIVGSAGIVAEILGEQERADEIAEALYQWFHYEGQPSSRKQRNFGEEGDFVESFHYADYGMFYPVVFSRMHPAFRLVPDALNPGQIRGFAAWLRKSILPVAGAESGNYPQQRFGDIQFYDGFMGIVWQIVAKLSGDDELTAVAYRIRSQPRHILEYLFWTEKPEGFPTLEADSSLEVFPHSGMAFFRNDDLRLTVRAGEFWGHNHLDAGSFVFHQSGITWIDDSGACAYGRPEYPEYYVSALAHNVAFAPELAPPSRRAHYEGLPGRAGYLLEAAEDQLKVLCAETGILSGGALARSYRWFVELGGEAVLIWDDLAAYQPREFSFLLHTACQVNGGSPAELALAQGNESCPLAFFSSEESVYQAEPAVMGQLHRKRTFPVEELSGQALSWKTGPVERLKFGLLLGTGLQSARWWRGEEGGGFECRAECESSSWRIWFNPRADGQVMHENCTDRWQDFETDAYALICRTHGDRVFLSAIAASFVREHGKLLFGNLRRKPLQTMELTKIPGAVRITETCPA